MQYSYWSGEVQGLQEKLMESFSKEPTFKNALRNLAFVMKMRSDFIYFKKKGMIDGELTPFDANLVKNVFIGARNSLIKKTF